MRVVEPGRFGQRRLLAVSGGLLLLVVALGAWTCAANAVPMAVWARNLVAWAAGAATAFVLARASPAWVFPAVLLVTGLLLAMTLFDPGQLGVHRWVGLGSLSINIAMLMLPSALIAIAALGAKVVWVWLLAMASLAILVIQPDASQATALGVALTFIVLTSAVPRFIRLAVLLGAVTLVGAAWFRPDPLQPVPEVEEIHLLAWAVSPVLAVVGLASLVLFTMAPSWLGRHGAPDLRIAAAALGLYLFVSAVMPFVGAFPVPFLGLGVSPILGAWLGLGCLAMLSRTSSAEIRRPGISSVAPEQAHSAKAPADSGLDASSGVRNRRVAAAEDPEGMRLKLTLGGRWPTGDRSLRFDHEQGALCLCRQHQPQPYDANGAPEAPW